MAEYRITYWRDIPSMVTARDESGATAKVQLPDRFQEVIDQRAMDLGLAGTNEYLEQWRLGESRPVLSDGAIGTMLQAAGLMPGTSPEIWNVEHEDRLRVIHTAYADAGAHLLTTNTFGGTRPRLALHGLEDRVHELNEAGARLAREVADSSGALA